MTTLHLVPHTHWDREWYLPFQTLRVKLVHLVDLLLGILETDPDFRTFTLDGQTIVLEDYLDIRPERKSDLRRHVRAGRLLIGPWYVLPDEFLVSPEAIVRNLLRGARICQEFGGRMDVGYIPDPFGHIGQMPQILRGFGIEVAAFRRGLADEPCEMWWEAPDGSRVLLGYLRDGYDNAVRLPVAPEAFARAVAERAASLAPHSAVGHLLLLDGTDHQEPEPDLPRRIVAAQMGDDRLILSTLPLYFEAVSAEVDARGLELPVWRGEARQPKRHHLLAGVLSSRTWIKERNHTCETLLEAWAEPFAYWAERLAADAPDKTTWTGHLTTPRVRDPYGLIEEAWHLLLQCHPHDSICGCSIDQVHEEMRSRFDQVEQITEEVTRQSLAAIAESVDTRQPQTGGGRSAVVVFNASRGPRTDLARARLELAAGQEEIEVFDEDGHTVPHRLLRRHERPLADMELDAAGVRGMQDMVRQGMALGLAVQQVAVARKGGVTVIEVVLAEGAEPDTDAVETGFAQVGECVARGEDRFRLVAHLATEVEVEIMAGEVPSLGYRCYGVRRADRPAEAASQDNARTIENEFLRVEAEADGSLSLVDLRSGLTLNGLARLSDRGDRGDSYNFCPLGQDTPIEAPASPPVVRRKKDACGQTLEIQLSYRLPRGLNPERDARSAEQVDLPVTLTAALLPGSPRVDLEIRLENRADDHRLQAFFPLPFPVDEGLYDGAFEVVRRATRLDAGGNDWVEQPAAESPARCFVAAARDGRGLLIALRGLREASVSPEGMMAVTLSRSFGWLSRDDLSTRKGDAGPRLEAPGGQSHGEQAFRLSLIPFAGDWRPAAESAFAFQAPLRAVGTGLHDGSLPARGSLLDWSPHGFRLTAVKAAEDGQGLIVRGVNLTADPLPVRLACMLPASRVFRARLDETAVEPLALEGGRVVRLVARPHEVVTVRFM